MTVSQILKTAEHKADVKNTNFIDYQQKLEILNNAYRQVYQEAINAGEQFFLKKISISDGQKLPEDFYTVQEVLTNDNVFAYNSLVPKMNGSNRIGYDIVNDRFILKGYRSVTLVYNPKPIYLTFPGKTVETKIPYSTYILDYWKNYFLCREDEEGVYTVRNEENSVLSTFNYSDPFEKAYIRDGFIYLGYNDLYNVIDYEGNVVVTGLDGTLIPGIDTVVALAPDGRVLKNGSTLFEIPLDEYTLVGAYYSELTNTLYFTDRSKLYAAGVDGVVELFETDVAGIGLMHYDDAEWVYADIGRLPKAFTDQGETSLPAIGTTFNVYYSSDDYLITKNGFYAHVSPIPDTDISWPNNVYYTYLSALVAFEFIRRLEGNVESINLELEERRFFKTIHRDNSQSYVIKDFGYFA